MTEDTIEKLKELQDILSQKFEIEREISESTEGAFDQD